MNGYRFFSRNANETAHVIEGSFSKIKFISNDGTNSIFFSLGIEYSETNHFLDEIELKPGEVLNDLEGRIYRIRIRSTNTTPYRILGVL